MKKYNATFLNLYNVYCVEIFDEIFLRVLKTTMTDSINFYINLNFVNKILLEKKYIHICSLKMLVF